MSVQIPKRVIVMINSAFVRDCYEFGNIHMTWSKYEAWYDPEGSYLYAQNVADKMGGRVRTFDPLTGRVY